MNNKVWHYRDAKRLSQQKFADLIGISRSGLCKIETGEYFPSVKTALQMAKFFNVRVEDLFQLKDK